MTTTTDLIASVDHSLRTAGDLSASAGDQRASMEWLITACSRLLQICELQERRQQQVAQLLDQLAEDIGFPVNSIHQTRRRIRQIATALRANTPPHTM